MKNRKMKIFISILCIVCLTFVFGVATACGSEDEGGDSTITYKASALAEGTVGTAYSATVATATGADGITYALKSGSTLPAGLTLSTAGAISGTPTAAVSGSSFTVVASAEGATSAEATFSITIKSGSASTDGYVFEAEYADLSGMKNIAGSFTPLIFYNSPNASNNMYLGDLGNEGNTIAFDITSDKAVTVTMEVVVRTCISSPYECTPEFMEVVVNNKSVNYKGKTLPYPANDKFTTVEIEISLQEGDNVIKFVTTDATDMALNGVPTMPQFDCIKIKTDATLEWEPNLDNEDIY